MHPRSDSSYGRARTGLILRTTGLVVAGLLGVVAIWMIVTGDTQKRVQLGVVLGAWGLLLAAISVFGARRHEAAEVGGELMIRSMTGIDRLSDASAVREYEQRLQALIRNEVMQTLGAELASLRSEVAALRSELDDKVGGQLRLERIETTRLIGSDLEALQHEVQQLKIAREARADEFHRMSQAMLEAASTPQPTRRLDHPVVDVVEAVTVTPEPPAQAPPAPQPFVPPAPQPFVPPAPVQAQHVEPQHVEPQHVEPQHVESQHVEPQSAHAQHVEPQHVEPQHVEPQPVPAQPTEQHDSQAWFWQPVEAAAYGHPVPSPQQAAPAEAAAPQPSTPAPPPPSTPAEPSTPAASPAPAAPVADFGAEGDPFASLPRIRPFTEFDLEPVEPVEPAPVHDYSGRRRSAGEPDASDETPAAQPAPSGGGRRRRADDDESGDDLLSRILERERQQH